MAKIDHIIENGILKEYRGSFVNISIPEGVIEVKNDTFEMFVDRKEIKTVHLPKSLIKIPQFQHCSNLSEVTVGDDPDVNELTNWENSIKAIDPYTFRYTGLEWFYLPGNVEEIGEYAFADCPNLRIGIGGNEIKKIGKYAFQNSGIPKFYLFESTVETIEEGAFSNCKNLRIVFLGNGIKKISAYAFANCVNIHEIFLPKSLEIIEKDAFIGCKNLIVYAETQSPPVGWINTKKDKWNPEDALVFYGVEPPPFILSDMLS
ncbi:MAG: leucine-rich repeat domain-containing protein [Clostridia bacterium]|nr:leucine-rich repeat domain-containing protein [Clostridia bacterium]